MEINVVRRNSRMGRKLMCTTYNDLSVKITGTLQVCNGCALSKAKSCVMSKKTYKRASHPGERIFVETTSAFPKSLIGNRYWICILDDCSHYSWSFFTKTKSQLPKRMKYFLIRWRHMGRQLSISAGTIQENTNQSYRGRAQKKRLSWDTPRRT